MKPIEFLRNTWKKLERGSETRSVPSSPVPRSTTHSPALSTGILEVKVHRVVAGDMSRIPTPPLKDACLSPKMSFFTKSRHRGLHRVASASSSDSVSLGDYPTYLQDPFNPASPSSIPDVSQSFAAQSRSRTVSTTSRHDFGSSNAGRSESGLPKRLRKTSTSSLRQYPTRLPSLEPMSPIDFESCDTDFNYKGVYGHTSATWSNGHRREYSDRNTDQSTRASHRHRARNPTAESIFSTGTSSPPRPRAFYQTLPESTPHLPFRPTAPSQCDTIYPIRSEKEDTDTFPLSLFPSPPPLIVRKKRPTALVIRPVESMSTLSSKDSTPIGTPTTPRLGPLILPDSPSQSITSSPSMSRKASFVRSIAISSPPPTSPPTSPLPDPPPPRAPQKGLPLRSTHSSINLRECAQPPRRRQTSSEPIPDQARTVRSPTAQRFPNPRRDIYPEKGLLMSRPRAPSTPTSPEGAVHWGIAF